MEVGASEEWWFTGHWVFESFRFRSFTRQQPSLDAIFSPPFMHGVHGFLITWQATFVFFQAAWDDTILGLVLRCLSDTSEKCRELAVQLIQKVADCIPEVCTNQWISATHTVTTLWMSYIFWLLLISKWAWTATITLFKPEPHHHCRWMWLWSNLYQSWQTWWVHKLSNSSVWLVFCLACLSPSPTEMWTQSFCFGLRTCPDSHKEVAVTALSQWIT
jgi:hypothetical protein